LITLDSVVITPVSLALQLTPAQDTIRLCAGASQTIQATVIPAGQPVSWSPAAGLQVGPGGTSVVATPTGSTLYTATVSLDGCTRTRRVYLALDSLPDNLDIQPADTMICQGAKVVLSAPLFEPMEYPDITFKWTPLSGTLSPDSLYNLVVQPMQTTIYRRITRNGVCPPDTAYATVKVIPPAKMEVFPADTSICPGATVHFTLQYTDGVKDIKWEPATGLSCSDCDDPFATPGTSQTYTISGDFEGCPVGTQARVTLKPLAPLQFPTKRLICEGESVTLNTLFDGSTYTWTSTHPGFGTKTLPNPSFVPTQKATYYVTADNGCIRMESVEIDLEKISLTVDGDTTICKNFSAPLSASVNVPGSFQWRNDLTGQTAGASQSITVAPDQTTGYTLLFTSNNGCTATGTVTVTIDGEAPTIVFPNDVQICPGESITLNTAPALALADYTWTANPPDPTLTDPKKWAPAVSPAVNTVYSVTATLGKCTTARQISVTAHQGTLTVTSPDQVCDSTFAKLTAQGTGLNGAYLWSTGSKSPEIMVMPAATTTYTVTFTYGDFCELDESVTVDWVPNFSLGIQSVPLKDTVNVGEPLTLTAVINPPQNLNGFTFMWQVITVDTKDIPGNTESIDVIPSTNDTASGEIRYRLTVTSPNGCVQVVEKKFSLIFPIVRFPNAFTPNGDDSNDEFKMIVPQGVAYISQMQIFNRWGQRIFESKEPDATWDGTVDGKEAPVDVYVYFVWWRRGDDALQVQATGEVTLLR